ncbi:hypothetical protein FRC01_007533, partial [Tulasnella sp. 417]
MEANSTFLSKSGRADLIVRCSEPLGSADEFLNLVNQHRHRWTTAVFKPSMAHMESMASYLTDPAPRLQRVKLDGGIWHHFNPRPPVHLLRGQTHNIRHLDLYGTRIQWLPNAFVGLKSLILAGISFEGLTTQYIRNLLAASPTLETLDLNSIEIRPSPTDNRSPSVHLTHLRHLRLIGMPTIVADRILRDIVVEPNLIASIQVQELQEEPGLDITSFLTEALPSLSSAYRRLNSRCRGSHLQVTRAGTFIWTARSNRGHSFLFYISHIRFLDGLRWIEQAVGADGPGVRVHLQLNDHASAAIDAVQGLKTSSIVTELRLKLDPEEWLLDCILDALSGSESGDELDGSGGTIPSFPALHTVKFYEWGWSLDKIEEALGRRFAKRTAMALPLPNLSVQISYSEYLWTCGEERMLRFDTMKRVKEIEGIDN